MRLKIGKTHWFSPKHNVTLQGKDGAVYEFIEGEEYPGKVLILNMAYIIIDRVRVTVNTSWIAENFKCLR